MLSEVGSWICTHQQCWFAPFSSSTHKSCAFGCWERFAGHGLYLQEVRAQQQRGAGSCNQQSCRSPGQGTSHWCGQRARRWKGLGRRRSSPRAGGRSGSPRLGLPARGCPGLAQGGIPCSQSRLEQTRSFARAGCCWCTLRIPDTCWCLYPTDSSRTWCSQPAFVLLGHPAPPRVCLISLPLLFLSLFSSPAWLYKWLLLALMSLYYTWLTMVLPGAGGNSLLRSCLMSQITACPKITFAFKWRAAHAGNPTLLLVPGLPFSQICMYCQPRSLLWECGLKSRGLRAELST